MKHKNKLLFAISLLIVLLSITMVSAEQNTTDILSIKENMPDEISISQKNPDIQSISDNDEKNLQSYLEDHFLSEEISVNDDITPTHGGKTFTKDYFGQEVTVHLTSSDISSLKKGIGFESYTGQMVKVPTYKKVIKTVKKPVKKTIFIGKINKHTGKIKLSPNYYKKTIKYALKYKYVGTYKKVKGNYIRMYQKYKGYKKVKKASYKKVWAYKELIVKSFKISKNCEYRKGYYLSFGFNGADREGWWDYNIQI